MKGKIPFFIAPPRADDDDEAEETDNIDASKLAELATEVDKYAS